MTVGSSAPQQLVYGLFKPECYEKFFVQHNFFDVACLRLLISKVLSIGIILGAVLVKIPQIVKIVRSRSTAGLAASMYALENLGYLITVVYNVRQGYAFSTYGENIFLLAQGLVIVSLFGLFNRRMGASVAALAFYAAFGYYLYAVAPATYLPYAQTCTIPVFAASRLPQIARNFSSKSTGVLSLVTVALNAAGSLARVFTTLSEVDDSLVLTGMIVSASMNVILLAQVLLYWSNTAAAEAEKPVKASKPSAAATTSAAAGKAGAGSKKKQQQPTKPKKQE